jgi:hypothetical protein
MLCRNEDMRLSTVAMLSARFPYISPSGHLKNRCAPSAISAPETYVVDGGYLDGTGASTLLGLWSALAPLIDDHNRDPLSRAFIVPFVIQIDNGYAEPSGPGEAAFNPQLLAPPKAFLSAHQASQAVSRQGLQLIFSKPFTVQQPPTAASSSGRTGDVALCGSGDRYALFSLHAHPGPQARVGWIFSNVALGDLIQQLTADDDNKAALDEVSRWFSLPPSTAC